MKKLQTPIIILIGLLLPAILLYQAYNPDAVASYGKDHGHEKAAHWTYAGEKSVFNWGDEEANELCKIGKEQSPIDLPKEATKKSTDTYAFNYTETEFSGENNGHAIEYKPKGENKNTLTLNGEVYTLVQFHFHNPSEHAKGGVLYPMEVHFVHKTKDGKIAVVGALIEVSDTPTLKGFWPETISKHENEMKLNISSIINGGGKHYTGSLTTPPCTEKIEWLVLDKAQTVTQEEANNYRKLLGSETNRPVQPTNGREITQA